VFLRKVGRASIVCSSFLFSAMGPFNPVAFAQDFAKTVLPITQLKWIGLGAAARFGTGFCLDRECRLIGTNYHVAVMAQPRKINGHEVIHRYLATGPEDNGATMNKALSGSPLRYTLSRDLAIFELRHPLPHHHGMAFSLHDLQIGQQVDIYAYPAESISRTRNLVQFHGAFKGEMIEGLLAFDYSFSNGKAIRPGTSGGLVVDRRTRQIVGVLSGIARDNEAVAVAVPIQSLADFVSKVQPWLAESLFPSFNMDTIPPTVSDLYPKFVPPPSDVSLQHRPEEPQEIKILREKAQLLADSMHNFIAVQSFEWGSGNSGPATQAEYEVRVIDDVQRFRKLPDGREMEGPESPHLNGFVVPADEWSKLPKMIGTDFRLKVNHAGDAIVNKQPVKIFQYFASVEDNLCPFAPVEDLVFFTISKIVAVPCYGEAWTDAETNIIRISQHLDLSQKLRSYGGWEKVQVVVTYGWLRETDEPSRLIPLTISTEAGYKKHAYWCRGTFTNYHVFSSRAKILASDHVQSLPP